MNDINAVLPHPVAPMINTGIPNLTLNCIDNIFMILSIVNTYVGSISSISSTPSTAANNSIASFFDIDVQSVSKSNPLIFNVSLSS